MVFFFKNKSNCGLRNKDPFIFSVKSKKKIAWISVVELYPYADQALRLEFLAHKNVPFSLYSHALVSTMKIEAIARYIEI